MLLHLIGSWVTLAFGLWVTAAVVPGFRIQGFQGALVVSLVLGVLHYLIGTFLFAFFTITTLGLAWLFAFVTWWFVTAILLSITDSLTDSLHIDRFRTALVASAVLSVLSAVRTFLLH